MFRVGADARGSVKGMVDEEEGLGVEITRKP